MMDGSNWASSAAPERCMHDLLLIPLWKKIHFSFIPYPTLKIQKSWRASMLNAGGLLSVPVVEFTVAWILMSGKRPSLYFCHASCLLWLVGPLLIIHHCPWMNFTVKSQLYSHILTAISFILSVLLVNCWIWEGLPFVTGSGQNF